MMPHVASHRSLKRYLANDIYSLKAVSLRLEASKFDPCLFFVNRRCGSAVGVITTHIGDLLGCGEQGISQEKEKFLTTRFVPVKVQMDNFAHIGINVLQKDDGSVEVTQKALTDLLRPIDTSLSRWKDRNRPLSEEELQICQRKLGELCWLATASRPDICDCWAHFSAKLKSVQGIDIYRINDLIKTVKKGQSDCALNFFAGFPNPSRRSLSRPDDGWGKPRTIHEDTMLLAG